MSDAADRLAQALRDLINEAVQTSVERERPTPPPDRAWNFTRCQRHDWRPSRTTRLACQRAVTAEGIASCPHFAHTSLRNRMMK